MTMFGKLFSGLIAFVILIIVMTLFITRVPAGYVGVKYNLYGSNKGVNTSELQPGYYFTGPNTQVFTFPTFTQTRTWENTAKIDESFKFSTVEGMRVGTALGITYHVDPAKVSTLFQTYRQGIDEITDVYLHNIVRDALVEQGSTMGIESVYGAGKTTLLKNVQAEVAGKVAPIGVVIDQISWVGDLDLPSSVVKSINNKIQATQMSQQRENEVAQAKAEAQILEAQAAGKANAARIQAQGDADAIKLRGDALSQHPDNERAAIERWDGHVPATLAGGSSGLPFSIGIK